MGKGVKSQARDPSGKASIVGTVTNRHRDPVAGAAVLITGDSPGHLDIAAVSNRQGQYRFDGLVPGAYSLMANAAGYPMQTRNVDVAAAQVARLDFVLDR
jgi:hypothetical protein